MPRILKVTNLDEHKYFERYVDLIDYENWKDHFKEFSSGVWPKGFSFKNMVLTYKQGKEEESLELTGSDYDDMSNIINFLCDNGGLKRPGSMKDNMIYIAPSNNWDSYKINARTTLINNYITKLGAEQKFSKNKISLLRTQLVLAVRQKLIKKDDVIMNNGCIESLNVFDENYDYNISFIKKSTSKPKDTNNDVYIKSFLTMLEKHRKKKNKSKGQTTVTRKTS